MPTKDKKFTLEDSDRMIKAVIDSFFQEENIAYSAPYEVKELIEEQGNGGEEVLPSERIMNNPLLS